MSRTETIADELYRSVFGDPWHGASAASIIDIISFEEAVNKPSHSAHTIFEIIFHITGWTEEVLGRFEGKEPSEPLRGDWRSFEKIETADWEKIKSDLYSSTEKLISVLKNFPEEQLDTYPSEERIPGLGTGFTYEGLICGLVQHTAYHMGQVSLLKKINSNR